MHYGNKIFLILAFRTLVLLKSTFGSHIAIDKKPLIMLDYLLLVKFM